MIYVATVQVCGTGPDQWWVAFSGQTVVAASQIFILGIPAQLAATWFPPNQMSTATSIGVFGNQASQEGAELELETKVHPKVRNHEKGHSTRAFFWLKASTNAFTFKTILRHFVKRTLTPRHGK